MTTAAERYDIYRPIHKGLRAFMAETLVRAGRLDAADTADVAETLAQVRGLALFCRNHLRHEDEHVHTAMEARVPGSTAVTAADHRHHHDAIAALTQAADAVEAAPDAAGRARAAHALYLTLARFVGENLLHMDVEEGHNNAVLRGAYADCELAALEHAIVASLSPEETPVVLRWILTSVSPAERAGALLGMRRDMPAEPFAGVLAMIRPLLSPVDRARLDAALGVAAPVASAA